MKTPLPTKVAPPTSKPKPTSIKPNAVKSVTPTLVTALPLSESKLYDLATVKTLMKFVITPLEFAHAHPDK